MSGALFQLGGMRVVVNDSMYPVPNRLPVARKWMRQSYLFRLTKKWIKRYGTHMEPVLKPGQTLVSEAKGFIVMRSDDLAKLKQQIGSQP